MTSKRSILRIFFRKFHRISGLVGGGFFFLLAVTGSLYVFREDVERIVDRSRYYVDSPQTEKSPERIPIDRLIQMMETRNNATVETIRWSESPNQTCRMILASNPSGREEGRRHGRSRLLFDIDPYSGEVKGYGAEKTAPFFRTVKRLHSTLGLSSTVGKPIVIGATILALLIFLSGLVLWFPHRWTSIKEWRDRLTIHSRPGSKRFWFDLHRTFGFYLTPLMILIMVTGLFLINDSHGAPLSRFYPRPVLPHLEESVPVNAPVSLASILETNRSINPDAGEVLIHFPPGPDEPLRIETKSRRLISWNVGEVTYWDRRNGSLVSRQNLRELTIGQKFAVLVRSLHDGHVIGIVSKIVYFLFTIASTTLFLTGLYLFTSHSPQRLTISSKPIRRLRD